MLPSILRDIGGAAYVSWTVLICEVGSVVAGAASTLTSVRDRLGRPTTSSVSRA